MSNISVFKNDVFGEIRIVVDNNEPWFCLKDVCDKLGLTTVKVVQRLGDDILSKYPIVDSLGRQQVASFVNEDGLYDVIMDSRKPEAKAFRKWVTSEVLPSIRKHGMYMTDNVVENIMTNPYKLLELVQNYANERQERLAAEAKADMLADINADLIDDNKYLHEVLQAKGLVLSEDIAKAHGISAIKMHKILNDEKIIFKRSGDCLWKLYQHYADANWGQTIVRISHNGHTFRQLKWTEFGAKEISKILRDYGYQPVATQMTIQF
jgi:prophage antirepressor-like protein